MSSRVLNPDATNANIGLTAVGAASIHAALNDASDATYVEGFDVQDDHAQLGFGTFSLPAGARVKSISPGYRANASSTAPLLFALWTPTQIPAAIWVPNILGTVEQSLVPWDAPTTDCNQATVDSFTVNVGMYHSGSRIVDLYKLYATVVYVEAPDVTITAPTADQRFTEQNTIRVRWNPDLDSDGGSQTAFAAKIFTEAVASGGGFDPDTSTAVEETTGGTATSWDTSASLANGNYRVYVVAAQTVNGAEHWGNWASQRFIIDAVPPRNPSISALAENTNGRIQVALTFDNSGVTTDRAQVERSEDAGATWESLRTVLGDGYIDPAGSTRVTVYDFESGNGMNMLYRVRVAHIYTGTLVWSSYITLARAVAWSSGDRWLKCATLPANNMIVDVWAFDGQERDSRQGVHMPLGATAPVVVSDTPGAETGEVQFLAETQAEQIALDAISQLGLPLLLQFLSTDERDDIWIVLGARGRLHLIDKLQVRDSTETYSWTQVEKPL